jgi:diguanylate cyclase (GGDEF)-like protein
MSQFQTIPCKGSSHGLFSAEQIQRLMRVECERAKRHKYPLVVLLIAVDRLGQLQDLYGTGIKDEIQRSLAELVRSASRSSDFLGCSIDDRVLVIIPHTPPEGASILARRVLEGARKMRIECEGRPMRVSVSIGGAHNQRPGELDFELLLEVARGGLDVAAQSGGDRYVHSELYEFFQKKREREARAQSTPGTAPAPIAAAPAASVAAQAAQVSEEALLRQFTGGLIGDRLRELLGVGQSIDPDTVARIERVVVAQALQELKAELVRALSQRDQEHGRQVDQLERRIRKLTEQLGLTEEQLQKIMRMKTADPGLASIYKDVQGLSFDEVQSELKKELLSKIFEANVALRKEIGR